MEKDWVLVYSIGKLYQAELLKEVFTENNIVCDVINKKDSLFLTGDVEVYVNKKDEAKALKLIEEFNA